jgi:hypothetical protein
MVRASSMVLAGACVLALSATAIPHGFAGDPGQGPVLPSDKDPVKIPPVPLPSDSVFGSQEPFTRQQDQHTGAYVPSDPIGAPTLGFIDEHFLTYDYFNSVDPNNHIRLDSDFSSCQYYKAIGAVADCSPFGDLISPKFNFKQWKQAVQIDEFGPDGKTSVAHFINQVDLNLTRDHHMIYHGPNKVAAYVCNHKPPAPTVKDPSGYFPDQHDIDTAIRDIKRKKQPIIACVAMEFSPPPAAPAAPAFTKFYIFGPDPEGVLLSAVDLDGRGPKGVPNVCTACHGGTFNYLNAAGQFDQTKSANGDLGAHFLPFDKANFAFSSKLSKTKAEDNIFNLNKDVYDTEIVRTTGYPGQANPSSGSDSITQTIKGWYGNVTATNAAPVFNTGYVPTPWDDKGGPKSAAYLHSVSHSCRTCHVAMDRWAFELSPTLLSGSSHDLVCNQNDQPTQNDSVFTNPIYYQKHAMPNSKVTFDRFWLTRDPTVVGQPPLPPGVAPQPAYLSALFGKPCFGP